jgi:undecaprenyl-diphosphatase
MIPAALVGVFLDDIIETFFDKQIFLVGILLLVTGGLLFLADRAKNTLKEVSFSHALVIGIAQAIAILPGISRSGATIGTSVLLGIDREKAARFSFLMVVPLILGKMAKDILDGAFASPTVPFVELSIGFLAAFITGLIACTWMITIVKKSKLTYFAVYCFVVGVLAISWTIFA